MNRKIIYLVNPISGTGGKGLLKDQIARETEKAGVEHYINDTRADGNYEYLTDKIIAENISDIVICGGDGSINSVASKLVGVDVNIGIIPMGSGNGLAFSAGIPKNIPRALKIILHGKPMPVDGFYINDQFSCMLCGIGFDAKVAHEFALQAKRGLKTYIKVTATNFFSAKPYKFRIAVNENAFETEAFFISIANSNQFGNNVTIAPKASLSDGLLDIVVVKKTNKSMLALSVFQQVIGLNSRRDFLDSRNRKYISYFQTPTLTIDNPEGAPLHIDGDPKATSASFKIRIAPGAIRLIQP